MWSTPGRCSWLISNQRHFPTGWPHDTSFPFYPRGFLLHILLLPLLFLLIIHPHIHASMHPSLHLPPIWLRCQRWLHYIFHISEFPFATSCLGLDVDEFCLQLQHLAPGTHIFSGMASSSGSWWLASKAAGDWLSTKQQGQFGSGLLCASCYFKA